ncbi:MAG: hypothetical protein V3T53_03970 [Phycisphaerales bacterium]
MKKQLVLLLVPAVAAWVSAPASADVIYGSGDPVFGGGGGGVLLDNDFYQYDVLNDSQLGLTAGGGIAWLHVFNVQKGGEIITAISSMIGSPVAKGNLDVLGGPINVYVWDDPNNDGDPSDAVLLGGGTGTVTSVNESVYMKIALDGPIAVTGSFIIGATVTHDMGSFPAPRDTSQASAGRAWVAGVVGGDFDPNNITGGIGLLELDSIGFPSVWNLRANAIPAPGALALLGLAGLAARRRRRA